MPVNDWVGSGGSHQYDTDFAIENSTVYLDSFKHRKIL